jgi:perosamine synthetase
MKYNLVEMFVDEEIKRKAVEIIESKRYIKGPESDAFQREFADYLGVKGSVTVSSGTTALHLIYYSLGIGKGDEIIAPSHTFIATVSPAMHLGAKPVFADIKEDTYNIDPDDVRRKITDRTKAITAVHLYGRPAEIKELREIADEHGIYLIEDACQAHGAIYDGKKIGNFGDIAAFSFFPSKVMTVAGDGGMVAGNDTELLDKIAMLRDQGRTSKYEHTALGFNFRMSEILAGIGRVQLKHLDEWVDRRNELARIYNEILGDYVITPEIPEGRHAFYVYTIRTKDRDGLREYLKKNDIGTGIYYPIPVHLQPIVKEHVKPEKLPVTERIVDEIISLPMHPQLSDEDADHIANKVLEFVRD